MNQKINTSAAPAAIGPYSQAVRVGSLLFASGMLPVIPEKSEMAERDITVQTKQIFSNIKALLSSCSLSLKNVVKTTVFLKSIKDFAAMNEVYANEFKGVEVLPARSAIEVAALPKDSLIEIELVASFE